jgi:hypothetical protein
MGLTVTRGRVVWSSSNPSMAGLRRELIPKAWNCTDDLIAVRSPESTLKGSAAGFL